MKVLFFAPTISPIVVLQMPISSEPSFPSSSRTSNWVEKLIQKEGWDGTVATDRDSKGGVKNTQLIQIALIDVDG